MRTGSVCRRLGRMLRPSAAGALILAAILACGTAAAQDIRFFQIGTGPMGENRFPLGGLIANAISNPPGSRQCDKGGSCGVPGLVAVAKSTPGPAANIVALASGHLDAALVRADIATWAGTGTGLFSGQPVASLRAVALFAPEAMQLVARTESGIQSLKDLKGKRVSFGEANSASLAHGRMLLAAAGLSEKSVRLSLLSPAQAADALAAGELDAFLLVDGAPAPLVAQLEKRAAITLVPLAGPEIDRLLARHPFLQAGQIPADAYPGMDRPIPTLSMGVALVADARQDAALIHGITRALWHPSAQRMLAQHFPRTRLILPEAETLARFGLSLHEGARAYYDESEPPAEQPAAH